MPRHDNERQASRAKHSTLDLVLSLPGGGIDDGDGLPGGGLLPLAVRVVLVDMFPINDLREHVRPRHDRPTTGSCCFPLPLSHHHRDQRRASKERTRACDEEELDREAKR